MNFDGIINTFTPLSDENCLKVLFALHEDEMTLEKLSQCSKTEIETAKSALRSLLEAGLVSSAEKQGEIRYFISPFGTFGAVNMLKEVLYVEQGCKGCK